MVTLPGCVTVLVLVNHLVLVNREVNVVRPKVRVLVALFVNVAVIVVVEGLREIVEVSVEMDSFVDVVEEVMVNGLY